MEPHNGLTKGQAVRLISDQRFRGERLVDSKWKVGDEGFVTKLGGEDSKFIGDPESESTHVVINHVRGGSGGSWVEADCLEPINEEAEIQEALRSISEAAKHQEHVLMFKSITVADAGGKELTIRVEGQQVYISDEYEDDLMTFDLESWINIQEVVDLAFRQINPMHVGKEKK